LTYIKELITFFDETETDMGKKGVVRYRKYTEEFKVEAVRLAESVGVAAAAKRLGVSDGNLRNWVDRGREGKAESADLVKPVKRPLAEVEAENSRLRRELESTRLDLEIVKKAAAYFAKESR
jgi:transposase